jgi:hypothetical protein
VKIVKFRNAISRQAKGIVWGHSGISGGQVVYHIGVREKVSPGNIGIRIRDPARSDVPTRKPSIGVWVIGISRTLMTR